MRLQQKNFNLATGFTLVELLFTISSAAIIGGAAVAIQSSALNLFRTNGVVNASHKGTRKIIDRLEKEIQSAISIPALVGTDRDVLDTTGPAPGIAFLRQSGPCRRIATTALAGSATVQLDAGPTPKIGQRLLIPDYDIEGDIIGVSGTTVTLAAPLPEDVKITSGSLSRNIVALVTDLVSYVVIDGQLREYQNASTNDYNVIAVGLTEPEPFGLPYNAVPNSTPSP